MPGRGIWPTGKFVQKTLFLSSKEYIADFCSETESVLMNLVVTSTNLAGVCAFDFEKIGKRMIIRMITLIFNE